MRYKFTPIGILHTCFTEKFGIPRQSGMVPGATAILELEPPFDKKEAIRGLEKFSHVWIIFVFHKHLDTPWRPTVRPPRLGGNKRMGVFSSRSPFRPNPIGMSSARLDRIDTEASKIRLHLSGVDILDGTPVLDIKPYVPWTDRREEASGGFAEDVPRPKFSVGFTPQALSACRSAEQAGARNLKQILEQALSHDPRPAYYETKSKKDVFGTRFYDVEVKWKVSGDVVTVYSVVPAGVDTA